MLSDSNTPHVFILGDFNANICKTETERRLKELKEFCINEGISLSDVLYCPDNSYIIIVRPTNLFHGGTVLYVQTVPIILIYNIWTD